MSSNLILGTTPGSTMGGQISAIGLDGKMRNGWRVAPRRPGARFESAVLGPDGTPDARAIGPEAYRDPPAGSCVATDSATVLAIDPMGRCAIGCRSWSLKAPSVSLHDSHLKPATAPLSLEDGTRTRHPGAVRLSPDP